MPEQTEPTTNQTNEKLLQCLLETMKEIKSELKEIRKSHQHTERMLQTVLTLWNGKPAIQVYNSNI